MKKSRSLTKALRLIHSRITGNDNEDNTAKQEFQSKSAPPDLAITAKMHNIKTRAEASGHYISAPTTRH